MASSDRADHSEVEWAHQYDGYRRLASTPKRLSKLIRPARNSFRAHGRVPDWCGVDFLQGWAFYLVRADRHSGGGTPDDEWSAVLEALRRHPDAEPHERPPALRPSVGSTAAHHLPTTFSDRPKMHRNPEFLSQKQERLWEPHVAPINSFVERIRAERGMYVPYVDPDSGGVLARVLFVLESPAKPASHGSGMLSADNDDGTAANIWAAYRESGLPRTHGLHWNAVPWYVGDGFKEKNVSSAQVESGHAYLLDLLKLAPAVRVVVAMGKPAQHSLLRIQTDLSGQGVILLHSIHPSPRNNARGGPEQVRAVFREAYELAVRVDGE